MLVVYSVKEMFLTVQGEGAQAGMPAVFLRFAGCNLWNGLERDRAQAVCKFCDTDFIGTDGTGGGQFDSAQGLAKAVRGYWPQDEEGEVLGTPWIVCTGGEPFLQLNYALIDALHEAGFKIAVETNGTITAPADIDWICVSPKANAPLMQTSGDELKLVYPQKENAPSDFEALDFDRFSLQPLDDVNQMDNARAAFAYCLAHPKWTLSLQTHKWIGVP